MKRVPLILLAVCLVTSTFSAVFAWELERPGGYILVNERTESARTDGKGSVGLGVEICSYHENEPGPPSNGGDYVKLRIMATANTRKILSYDVFNDSGSYVWRNNLPTISSLGDNSGAWVYMGIDVSFYGVSDSCRYDSVWVCSNGFISFDPNRTATDPYYSYGIPSLSGPNTFVAPFWKDLRPDLGGSITCGIIEGWPAPSSRCFCISWNDVPDKSGNLQSFQVLLEEIGCRSNEFRLSRIWFQYKSITLNDQITIGIEDQQGAKGIRCNYMWLNTERVIRFQQMSDSAYVGELSIALTENEVSASTEIDRTPSFLRGHNIILDQGSRGEDLEEQYFLALEGGATLLLTGLDLAAHSVPIAGFMVDTFFITVDWARYMARQQEIASQLQINSTYARAEAVHDPNNYHVSDAVDASFCVTVYWIFTDENTQRHDLTVTAGLKYAEYDLGGNLVSTPGISTSTTLTTCPDDNNGMNTADPITSGITYERLHIGGYDNADYYSMSIGKDYNVRVQAQAVELSPNTSKPNFYVRICDSTGATVANSGPGYSHDLNYKTTYTGQWYIKVEAYVGWGFYRLTVTCTAPSTGVPWPGGACPFLYVYNGTEYACEGLLPIHNSEGIDVVANHTLASVPQRVNGTFLFRLVEHPQTHSRIDQVKLYAILRNNLTVQLPLIWARHSENGFVLPQMLFSDEWKTEILGADWNNGTSQSIDLRFLALPSFINATGFIFQTEGNNPVWKR